MGILIKGGRVIDPAQGMDREADVLVGDGRVEEIGRGLAAGRHLVIDATGCLVCPGLVDMHVHLRDPGQTHKEDLASGTLAAVRGGVTSVACMANTEPPIDHPTVLEYVRSRAKHIGKARVYPVAAVTKGLRGEELAPIGSLVAAGAVALSDDGRPVMSAGLMKRAMEYARMFGVPIISHCEDLTLSEGGVVNEGPTATLLGLKGIPSVAEEVMVARDLLLAEATGVHLHIAHVSTAGSVRLLREAKRRGVRVTAEVTPHHLALTEEALLGYDSHFKVNPPLRSRADIEALLEGLQDGTIDAIATDHAPHALEEKSVEFDRAPFGAIGLETLVGVVFSVLVHPGHLSEVQAIGKLTVNPARILGIPRGTLSPGSEADIVVIDPSKEWTVTSEGLASKSKNCPFLGWRLRGKAVTTIVGGQVVYSEQVEEVAR
jgi:dihydroorotase